MQRRWFQTLPSAKRFSAVGRGLNWVEGQFLAQNLRRTVYWHQSWLSSLFFDFSCRSDGRGFVPLDLFIRSSAEFNFKAPRMSVYVATANPHPVPMSAPIVSSPSHLPTIQPKKAPASISVTNCQPSPIIFHPMRTCACSSCTGVLDEEPVEDDFLESKSA